MGESARSEFVKIAPIESIIESQLIQSILEERQVPHRLRSYHDTAYDGLFQVQKGWGVVYAPDRYRDEICTILTDIRSSQQHNSTVD